MESNSEWLKKNKWDYAPITFEEIVMVIITMNTLALSNYKYVLNRFPLSIGDSFKWKERMKEKPNSLFDSPDNLSVCAF